MKMNNGKLNFIKNKAKCFVPHSTQMLRFHGFSKFKKCNVAFCFLNITLKNPCIPKILCISVLINDKNEGPYSIIVLDGGKCFFDPLP
eukprot:UN25796